MTPKIDGKEVRSRRENLPGSPSQRDFAKKIGISYVTLNEIETGKSSGSRDMIERVSKGLGCKPADITKKDVELVPMETQERSGLKDHEVPDLGTLSASRFSFSFDMPFDNLLPFTIRGRKEDQFASFTVRGDCMEPEIRDGDRVVVRAVRQVEDGTISVVCFDGECTLKRVYKKKDGVVLKADNPKYPPKTYPTNKIEVRAEVWSIMRKPTRRP